MLSARTSSSDVLAWNVTKQDAPFYCPVCEEEVVVKKGQVKVHHFAHIPPSTCIYGSGESEEHRQAKMQIYSALQIYPNVSKLQLERYLQDVRPDISFYVGSTPVAIEVQISTLSLDVIERRTKAYATKGIYLLWTSPYQDGLIDGKRYTPRLWEKYLHTLYFGKVYYWTRDDTLLPVRFNEYQIDVPLATNCEGEYVGGYTYSSKRFRTLFFCNPVSILELSPCIRHPYSSSKFSVPSAKLWM